MSTHAQTLLDLYRAGYFPMADARDADTVQVLAPHMRALLPIRDLHISRRLLRTLRQTMFDVRVDTATSAVIAACAAARPDTWINPMIEKAYNDLAAQGHVHSVEVWDQDRLVGGLYGVSLGGLFCGESMFSHMRDASKIALVHLCARLSHQGYTLLDAQFDNPHLHQFGQYTMPHEAYVQAIAEICDLPVTFADAMPQAEMLRRYLSLVKPPSAS
ncbi:MAG: leucyl/phenylalanyl-tRNA--protein transferase [Pseudomonadota bacterium]